jgi:hypothetical protein
MSSNRRASRIGQAQSYPGCDDDSPQLEPMVKDVPNTAIISGRFAAS